MEDSKALAALQRLEAIDAELEAAAAESSGKLHAALAHCNAGLAGAAEDIAGLEVGDVWAGCRCWPGVRLGSPRAVLVTV